ncbi:hypothetical protein Q31a_29640 [Aureliella helgolandensis]|uniref:Uncharacterized protein n=1 Tax=Aureliella helgolandensis TaxID=2527968 RepID=A0A518G7T2_9BACT|nr:hypothetical protein Q31a_29640 [Aureliella helgolandensis]
MIAQWNALQIVRELPILALQILRTLSQTTGPHLQGSRNVCVFKNR